MRDFGPIAPLIGGEHALDDVSFKIGQYARSARAAVVGAYQVTCSDESERECVEVFHRRVVRVFLPALKYWSHSSFRTANLGARYEEGAITIAEEHFATESSETGFKLLVTKLNSHVAVSGTHEKPIYGSRERYDQESHYCGALHAMLSPGVAAFAAVSELRRVFGAGGLDRLAMLRDPELVPSGYVPLAAAVVNARLQTRALIHEIADHEHHTETVHLVVPCVTFNRENDDTELVVGCYYADTRPGKVEVLYRGLGDDPSRYRYSRSRDGSLTIAESD